MIKVLLGDCREVLKTLPDCSINCCVTSPPYYGLRDYGVEGQIGLEESPETYVTELVSVFSEVRRVLRDDGTCWLNLGDSYASGGSGGYSEKSTLVGFSNPNTKGRVMNGNPVMRKTPSGLKPKDLIGIPWMVAFALRAEGWYLRQDIIWHKPNPMPESVTDRCTKAHEYVFLLTKSAKYYFNVEAISEKAISPNRSREKLNGEDAVDTKTRGHGTHCGTYNGTRNKRSVWTIPTESFGGAHFAVFPQDLIRPMLLAGCPVGGTVLDPFGGSGTTGKVAASTGRNSILIELNPSYINMAKNRGGLFAE